MQIIGLYFTNSLEKDYSITLKEHNTIREAVRCKYRKFTTIMTNGKRSEGYQNLLSEYANRREIGEIRFIDKDQIIMATTKQSNRGLINQKANDSSVQNTFSRAKPIITWFSKTMVVVKNVSGFTTYQ